MPRSRFLKHDFFLDEDLAERGAQARLLFQGLWLLADREGRLEDRPKKIKAQIFPYESVDVSCLLDELGPHFVVRYGASGKRLLQIRNFLKHQRPHINEPTSLLPGPAGEDLKELKSAEIPPGNRGRTKDPEGSGKVTPIPGKSGNGRSQSGNVQNCSGQNSLIQSRSRNQNRNQSRSNDSTEADQ